MFRSKKFLSFLAASVLVVVLLVIYACSNNLFCDHYYSVFVSDENTSDVADGTKTMKCDNCGEEITAPFVLSSPGNFSATQTTSAITLTWDKVDDAIGYRVYYQTDGEWKTLERSIKETTCTVDNLTPGTKMRFAVSAYKRNLLKTAWSEGNTELYTSTKPVGIESLTTDATANSVKLDWDSITDADGYRVYVKDSDGWKVVVSSTKKTSCTVENLDSGTYYSFAVRSYTETDSRIFSDYKIHNTSTLPEAPLVKIQFVSKNEITLDFKNVNGAEKYEIYTQTETGEKELHKTTESPESISFSLKPDTYYTYSVRACRTVGEETVYGDFRYVTVHCGKTEDRIVANPEQENWNLVLVNKERELPEGFKPELVAVQKGYELDYRVAPYFTEMYKAALAEGVELICNSAYRSCEYQAELFEIYTEEYMLLYDISREEAEAITATEVLAPGTSEHNLGFAVDILNSTGYEYTWLRENAHKYGFIERYTEEKEYITKIIPEPWHWRFVGVEYAEKIKDSGLCLEEYLEMHNLIP